MSSHIVQWLASDDGFAVHIGVLVLLLIGGVGFPMPEDIPLLLAGVAASKGIVSVKGIFVTCYIGVVLADQIVYWIGYSFGKKLLAAGARSPLFPNITDEKINTIRDGLRRRRLFYIFLGRHLFPLRTATFLCAGALHIPYIEFALSDALAALVSVTVVVGLGYLLGAKLTPEVVQHLVHQAHFYILALTLGGTLVWLLNRQVRKYRAGKDSNPSAK